MPSRLEEGQTSWGMLTRVRPFVKPLKLMAAEAMDDIAEGELLEEDG